MEIASYTNNIRLARYKIHKKRRSFKIMYCFGYVSQKRVVQKLIF